MRKTKIKKVSKAPISKIQRQIWEECKRIIRAKYLTDRGYVCYTCGKSDLVGSDCQTGHMIPKSTLSAFLKYDLRLLRLQCTRCNIWGGGMGAIFIENMRKIEGNEYVDQIMKDRQVTVKAYDHYVKILEEYKKIEK